ncbi:MAG: InlB B-repeat-containing protein [Oscillospiraceae bacterium]|nr:InlB B-repeat-containing protein [Oscillospiraceae bacterium]
MAENTPRKEPQSSFRGLYRHVKISVKTLDRIIIGGIAAIVILVLFGLANNGYTVTFDSKGGSDVPSQEAMYADYVVEPEDPTREGYVFTGWYSDENCIYLWDMENGQISQSMTLYAGWEKIE